MQRLIPGLIGLVGLLLPLTTHAARHDVAGTVKRADGSPVAGATVYVYTAAVKTGTSPFCPSCYMDCGKRVTTDAAGAFSLPQLDGDLKFRLLVVGEGYRPAFVTDVDPQAAKPISATLAPQPAVDPAKAVRGRVIDPDGKPVVGAVVESRGWKKSGQQSWGTPRFTDPLTITNDKGEFALPLSEPIDSLNVLVEARSLAYANFNALAPGGDKPHELKLGRGAMVTGRLLDAAGVPVKGVPVGLVQADRNMGVFTQPHTIGTDDTGAFAFSNIGPGGDYYVYGMMTSGHSTPAQRVSVAGDDTTVDIGELRATPGHRIAGKVVLSDGKPVPAGTRILLTRRLAWDNNAVEIAADGRFAFPNVPAEVVRISVRVKGYHLSTRNPNLSRAMPRCVEGAVEKSLDDLTIILEPGATDVPDSEIGKRAKTLVGASEVNSTGL